MKNEQKKDDATALREALVRELDAALDVAIVALPIDKAEAEAALDRAREASKRIVARELPQAQETTPKPRRIRRRKQNGRKPVAARREEALAVLRSTLEPMTAEEVAKRIGSTTDQAKRALISARELDADLLEVVRANATSPARYAVKVETPGAVT